jgi:hypothetical protein
MHTYRMDEFVNPRNAETKKSAAGTALNQPASLRLFGSYVAKDFFFDEDEYLKQQKLHSTNSSLPGMYQDYTYMSKEFKVFFSKPEDADSHFGKLDDYIKHGDPWKDNPRVSVQYYLRQQYSLLQLSEILQRENAARDPDDKFRGAIFLRPDMFWYDNIDLALFQHVVQKPNRIALPTWFLYFNTGFNDRFAFGSVDAMVTYASRGKYLLEYSQSHEPHAEGYLKDFLCGRNFEVHMTRTRMGRMRLHGIHGPDGPGGLQWLIRANEDKWKTRTKQVACPYKLWQHFGQEIN